MSLAMEEAKKSQINYQVGCIAVVSGKIVARGAIHTELIQKTE